MAKTESVHFARSGDVDIAWTRIGSGPLDILFVPGFISHLDLMSELAPYAAVTNRLGRLGRVVTFDKRGTGLSGRDLGFGSLAERADDIRAVMDAAGLEAAHLIGFSEGGPLSIVFAAAHPQRVTSLTIYGSYASMQTDHGLRGDPAFDGEMFLRYVERSWGDGRVLGVFVHAPDDAAVREHLGRYERACAAPRLAAGILRRNMEIDVRPLLHSVGVRTRVIHCEGDPIVPVELSRSLADGIPDAEFVSFPGSWHCGWSAQEWAPALDALEEFLTGISPAFVDADRVLATVMFTDIVDSTERAASIGDRAWRDVLDRHDDHTKRVVARFGGTVVKHTGDGTLATFDSPARAVNCARTLRDDLDREGIVIRAGLHTGEIERRVDDVGGLAVHIGARVAALAGPRDVYVSRTVHDLVAGSELQFDDRGEHDMKGVPAPWQVYALA